MKRLVIPLAAALALGLAATAGAFSYQGALADPSGNPMQATQDRSAAAIRTDGEISFKMYIQSTHLCFILGIVNRTGVGKEVS